MYKQYTLSSGKRIHVFDGLVPLLLREKVFSFANASCFTIGFADNDTENGCKHRYLHSKFSEKDDATLGLIAHIKTTPVNDLLTGLTRTKSVINLSVPVDSHLVHAHAEKLIVLYYVNLDWQAHWHGETLFFSENLQDIEVALPNTPGRIIVFEGGIPHAIRPQSISADHYRFTHAISFN